MTRKLNVYLYGKRAGVLSEDDLGHLQFQYYPGAEHQISVRMPVHADIYERLYAEPFFDNLTPEGDPLKIIAAHYGVSANNPFSILDKIGGDCAGAVSLYEGDMPQSAVSAPIAIDEGTIAKIIDNLPTNPLLTGIDNAPRLSLAGAQSKFAVRKDDTGKYYRSDDMRPTTHIIKIKNTQYPSLLENELFCMMLVDRVLGNKEVPVRLSQADGRPYLEIKRYDRRPVLVKEKWINTEQDLSGLLLVQGFKMERIHQEDFCQVLGYPANKKYQTDGGPNIRDLYNAVAEYSVFKAKDAVRFINLMMFNYLIGNEDAHAKNFSILHNGNGTFKLAPAYDLLSTEVYSSLKREIAMLINGKGKYDAITKKDWLALYGQLGLNPTTTMQEMKRNFADIVTIAETLCDELNADDLTKSDIYDEIIAIIKKRFTALFGE